MGGEWTADEVVGLNVADLRRSLGLSQRDLARDLTAAGFPWERDTVSQIEAGRRRLSLDELAALAAYFELPIRVLVTDPTHIIEQVTMGTGSVSLRTWSALWRDFDYMREPVPSKEGALKPSHRTAIDSIFKSIRRPWARIWRRQGGSPENAFVKGREEGLSERTKYPGPIFVATGEKPFKVDLLIPPWFSPTSITVEPDYPYVARDELEAQYLENAEAQGQIRRITRAQAHSLRAKRKGTR